MCPLDQTKRAKRREASLAYRSLRAWRAASVVAVHLGRPLGHPLQMDQVPCGVPMADATVHRVEGVSPFQRTDAE